ncbi:hypothetical protein DL96DRAFT_1464450 [Flagelloscypha sp. PMI_526]|nr:hypothetical protein DL96DRAFT_1464450 [Flagelloscypha sp. PMI_526]
MSTATPSLITPPVLFPRLFPNAPKPHLRPLLPYPSPYGRLNAFRDLNREMDDLSDEEREYEELREGVNHRGATFIVPVGRNLTAQEEKNDAEEEDDESTTSGSSNNESTAPPTEADEDEEGSDEDSEEDDEDAVDMDASMEDLDEADLDGDMEDMDGL